MNGIPIRSALLAAGLVAVASVTARANTITPSTQGWLPGIAIVYGARLSSGEIHPGDGITTGDGFTIFDIGGFAGFGTIAPNWVATSGPGSLYSLGSQGPDDPGLTNVTFRYTGLPFEANFGDIFLGSFFVLTSSTALTTDDWVSRDHMLGTPFVIDGVTANPHRDEILVPEAPVTGTAVPDNGPTLTFLGLGLLAVGTVRRRILG